MEGRQDIRISVRMAAIALSLVLFLFWSTSPLYGQRRRDAGGRPPTGSGSGRDFERMPPPEFDNRPFDITIDRLPRFYAGYNVELLYDNMQLITRGGRSRESMATGHSEQPRGERVRRPSAGLVGPDNIYALQIKPTESYYNSREQVLQVYLELSALEAEIPDKSLSGFLVRYEPQMDNRYTYTNPAGKKVEIEETKFRDYTVLFDNHSEFPIKRDLLPSVKQAAEKKSKKADLDNGGYDELKSEFILAALRLPKKDADTVKEMLKILLICEPVEPYVTAETVDIKPTLETPRTYFAQHDYLHTHLLALWFYDFDTGRVLMKMKPKVQ